LALDKACLLESLTNNCNERRVDGGRTAAEHADDRDRTLLLRASRERPRSHYTEQRDEVAAPPGCFFVDYPFAENPPGTKWLESASRGLKPIDRLA
jgi:hypothetical protein